PYTPFALNDGHRTRPVSLGMRGLLEGRVYEYIVRFNRAEVVEESLERTTGADKRELFRREGQKVSGVWTEEAQFELLSKSFRPNALLLALADALAPSLAGSIAVGLRQLLGFCNLSEKRPLPDAVETF